MALADLLTSYSGNLPGAVSQVLTVLRRPNTVLSLPTRVKVSAYKHLLTNDRLAEQALYSVYIQSKRFGRIASRDATFARLNGSGQEYFGRIEFFFACPLAPGPGAPQIYLLQANKSFQC